MSTNEVSSKILSDASIIAKIYEIIKDAGLIATKDRIVQADKSNVCIIKANQPHITRISGCTTSNKYSIEYDSNDLVIVGGAALNLYDYKLNDFKERHRINSLEKIVKKMTSDIDIVWWPRSVKDNSRKNVSNVIVTSQSSAIHTLASKFVEILNQKFKDNLADLSELIKGLTNIEVIYFETRPAGVINININFIIGGVQVKMCDILVHDSGASQRYDFYGREITTILPMTDDTMYINPLPGRLNSVRYLIIDEINKTEPTKIKQIDVAVPNILLFVKQQMLAFNNLIRLGQPKSLINYKRIQYVKNLLSNFTPSNNNINNLGEVFSTNNINYTRNVVAEIDNIINESISLNKLHISNLCSNPAIPKDIIITELCKKTVDLSKVGILEIEGLAPAYPPPQLPIQPFYIEYGTNRRIKWLLNSEGRGHWFYLKQPPLPPGPPPFSSQRQGGIRRNKTYKNKID